MTDPRDRLASRPRDAARHHDAARSHLVIGDIHGCADELDALVQLVADPARRLVSVGDLVAKGPAPHEVIAFFQESSGLAVLGNHDDHAIRRVSQCQPTPRSEGQALTAADVVFLEHLPLWLRLEVHRVLVVHAGLLPGVPVEKQERDHLLSLRSFREDGSPSSQVEGTPWAESWTGPEHVVFGHDAVRGLQQLPHATGLDSGCVYGHRLTGLLLPEHELVSVPAKRVYRQVRK